MREATSVSCEPAPGTWPLVRPLSPVSGASVGRFRPDLSGMSVVVRPIRTGLVRPDPGRRCDAAAAASAYATIKRPVRGGQCVPGEETLKTGEKR